MALMRNAVGVFFLGIGIVIVLVSAAVEAAGSHQSAPAPAVDCSSLVLNMADCLSFVTSGSTVKKPEGTCCDGLKHVLKTDSECLCEAFKNSAQLGVTLNVTKALSLPAECHVNAPAVSNCGLSVGSGAAPALSPIALAPGGSSGAPSPFGGSSEVGSAPAPAPAPGSSGSSWAVGAASWSMWLGVVGVVAASAWV